MNRRMTVAMIGVGAAAAVAWADQERIAFPANYQAKFANYLSLDHVQNDDQIIRLFADDVALNAASEGRELPDGSILVGSPHRVG